MDSADSADAMTWGKWTFKPSVMVLVHADNAGYEVDLEDCLNSARALDWIAQIAGKTWVTAKDLGDFVRAIDDLIGLQENLCRNGHDQSIFDVRAVIERRQRSSAAASSSSKH